VAWLEEIKKAIKMSNKVVMNLEIITHNLEFIIPKRYFI